MCKRWHAGTATWWWKHWPVANTHHSELRPIVHMTHVLPKVTGHGKATFHTWNTSMVACPCVYACACSDDTPLWTQLDTGGMCETLMLHGTAGAAPRLPLCKRLANSLQWHRSTPRACSCLSSDFLRQKVDGHSSHMYGFSHMWRWWLNVALCVNRRLHMSHLCSPSPTCVSIWLVSNTFHMNVTEQP